MSLACNAATEGWDRRITVTSRFILAAYWLLSQKQQQGNTLSPKKGPTRKHTCISLLKQMWKFKKKHLHFNWRRFRFQYWSYRAMRNGQWSSFSDPVSSLLIQLKINDDTWKKKMIHEMIELSDYNLISNFSVQIY